MMVQKLPMFPDAFWDLEDLDLVLGRDQAPQDVQCPDWQATSSSSSRVWCRLAAAGMGGVSSSAGRPTCWGRRLRAAARHRLGTHRRCGEDCDLLGVMHGACADDYSFLGVEAPHGARAGQ